MPSTTSKNQAFTLIELLVVIAIIALLSIVVILVLQPSQLLMQSRDSNRLSDMSVMSEAVGVYLGEGGTSLGSANTAYVSIPDPTATTTQGDQCQGLGLLSLPAGYTYQCAASSTYRQTNGTGWVPISFQVLPAGSPLGALPLEPINASSSRDYYTYTTNGSQFEFTAPIESQKYQLGGSNDVISTDGGSLTTVYEKGTLYGLEPLEYGDPTLVGDWSLDEGTGTVAYDYSGNNATGTWHGTQVGTNGYYSPGKGEGYQYAGYFDGSTDYVNLPHFIPHGASAWPNFSLTAWINLNSSNYNIIFCDVLTSSGSSETTGNFCLKIENSQILHGFVWTGNNTSPVAFNSASSVPSNQWVQIAMVSQNNAGTITLYIDGAGSSVASSQSFAGGGLNVTYIGADGLGSLNFTGLMDNVRIYNRALTSAQIAAMYAGGK